MGEFSLALDARPTDVTAIAIAFHEAFFAWAGMKTPGFVKSAATFRPQLDTEHHPDDDVRHFAQRPGPIRHGRLQDRPRPGRQETEWPARPAATACVARKRRPAAQRARGRRSTRRKDDGASAAHPSTPVVDGTGQPKSISVSRTGACPPARDEASRGRATRHQAALSTSFPDVDGPAEHPASRQAPSRQPRTARTMTSSTLTGHRQASPAPSATPGTAPARP
jgi:hypothetical protein